MKKSLTGIAVLFVSMSMAQTEVYYEDFQAGLPVTYTIVDNDGLTVHPDVTNFSDAWIALEDPDNPGDTIVGSTSYFSPAGRADRWLITPPVTLGAFGNILSWEARSHDASFLDGYHIYISVTDTEISSFIDTLALVTLENPDWTAREINVSEAGYYNQTVHFAFVNRTNDGFKLYLDDIRLVIEDPVGISEVENVELLLFPNPAQDMIEIRSSVIVNEVKVFSVEGKCVLTSDAEQIDIAGLNSGIYHVILQTEAGTLSRRLVKK